MTKQQQKKQSAGDSEKLSEKVLKNLETQHKDTNQRIDKLSDEFKEFLKEMAKVMNTFAASSERQNSHEKDLERIEGNQFEDSKEFKRYKENNDDRVTQAEILINNLLNYDRGLDKIAARKDKIKAIIIASLCTTGLIGALKLIIPLIH